MLFETEVSKIQLLNVKTKGKEWNNKGNSRNKTENNADINKIKRWCFEKIFNIYKPIERLVKKKTEKTISNIRNKTRNINVDTTFIKIIKEY